jgi:hypothetical protein
MKKQFLRDLKIAHSREYPRHHTKVEGIGSEKALERWVFNFGGSRSDVETLIKKGEVKVFTEVLWLS